MKTILLTQNKFAIVDDEDFEYLNQFKWHWMKNRFGPDGLTYHCDINTANGSIIVDENPIDDSLIASKEEKENRSGINSDEKKYLKKKFFELEKQA